MQQYMGDHLEEELRKTKERLSVTEKERDRALDDLKEMKKVAGEANLGPKEATCARKVAEIQMELKSVKDALSIASQELMIKEKNAERLKNELAERGALLDRLKGELRSMKASETNAIALLSDSMTQIQKLEVEIKEGKESDTKAFQSLVAQTKQLEQTKILLEESKLEIASLHGRMKKLEASSGHGVASKSCLEENSFMKKSFGSLKSELLLAPAQEAEKVASLKEKTLVEEMDVLKNELKLVTEAEENGKKAMDDLALALKEVAMEATQVKEKLGVTEAELEYTKDEAENLKLMLKSETKKYEELLDEARKEAERYKNTAERLRLEAEETLLAWNGKETGFVDCIKRAEEERSSAQEEIGRLLEMLTAAEQKAMATKEEYQKLRDILKQALNEANLAKEAAGIAQAENSQLKDSLAEKEKALNYLSQDNENLRIHEAAAFENIKELKRLLSEALKKEDKDPSQKFRTQSSMAKEHKDGKISGKAFGFTLKQQDANEYPENDEAERGLTFDTVASPDSAAHQRENASSVHTNGRETLQSDDLDHLFGTHLDDPDNDKGSRKKKALLRRFGDLLRRRNQQREEPSME